MCDKFLFFGKLHWLYRMYVIIILKRNFLLLKKYRMRAKKIGKEVNQFNFIVEIHNLYRYFVKNSRRNNC